MTYFLLKETFLCSMVLFVSFNLMSTGQTAAVGNFKVVSRMTHKEACTRVYKSVAYSLWKHLCGIPSAGKREDIEKSNVPRADSPTQTSECLDEQDKERQRDLEWIKLFLESPPDQQHILMGNDETYY